MSLRLLSCLALFVVTLATFAPVRDADFVNYDDNEYVSANPMVQRGLDGTSLRWAFTEVHSSNWHPLTWIAHMLDVELFGGRNAGAHHLANVAVHALAAVALAWLGFTLTGLWWPSLLVAALFALHPMHVESVAWISERKDTLSALLAFLCLIAYARFARAPRFSVGPYALTTVLFALGLMAKPMLVTLPAVMLLLDVWPLRRNASWTRRLVEKLPWMALVAGSVIATLAAQRAGGALRDGELIPLVDRVANAALAVSTYLQKLFWPTDLAIFYPHWAITPTARPGMATFAVAFVVVLGLTAAALWLARRRGWTVAAIGWLLFLGLLAPVIGIVQVGLQSHADRYTYLPYVGLFMIAAAAAHTVARRSNAHRAAVLASVVVILGACAFTSNRQARVWHDSETLFSHALEVTEDNWIAHLNLGKALSDRGDYGAAARHYAEAVRIQPRDAIAQYNFANMLRAAGRLDDAIEHYERVLQIDPGYAAAANNLGDVYARQGRFDDAIRAFERAISADPTLVPAHKNLCRALLFQARGREALAAAERLVELTGTEDAAALELLRRARAAAAEEASASQR